MFTRRIVMICRRFVPVLAPVFVFLFVSCELSIVIRDASEPVPVWDMWWERHITIVNEFAAYDETVDGVIDMVFIGDSLVHLWEIDGREEWNLLKADYKIYNLGFGGDLTGHVIYRLNHGEFPATIKPRYVVLLIGTNNVSSSRFSVESIAASIGKILDIIRERSRGTTTLLMPVLPREDIDCAEKILYLNAAIKKYEIRDNVVWFDFAAHCKNAGGSIKAELFNSTRLHLSPAGYKLWREKLLEQLPKTPPKAPGEETGKGTAFPSGGFYRKSPANLISSQYSQR
jgi:lysophospholipase L1-like esterase